MAIFNGHNEDSSGNILLSLGNGMTATIETEAEASQSYTKGSFIFFDNKLCKTTQAIARGATLAIGTNLSVTSIAAELTSHLRASNGDEFYFDYLDNKPGYYPSLPKQAADFVPFGGTNEIAEILVWTHTGSNNGFEWFDLINNKAKFSEGPYTDASSVTTDSNYFNGMTTKQAGNYSNAVVGGGSGTWTGSLQDLESLKTARASGYTFPAPSTYQMSYVVAWK